MERSTRRWKKLPPARSRRPPGRSKLRGKRYSRTPGSGVFAAQGTQLVVTTRRTLWTIASQGMPHAAPVRFTLAMVSPFFRASRANAMSGWGSEQLPCQPWHCSVRAIGARLGDADQPPVRAGGAEREAFHEAKRGASTVSDPGEDASRARPLPETRLAGVLLASFLLVGTALRLMNVGPALLFGDELHSLGDMHGGYPQILTHFSSTGGGLALPLLQRLLLDFFGDGHWSVRAPAWLAGLALLYLTFPIARRQAGEAAALVATAEEATAVAETTPCEAETAPEYKAGPGTTYEAIAA